ncbi:hypothetical protein ACN28I_23380 [Archangium gephyra]|uniref:hypothetical protein n=1 Tax=Archangium gephyra TaxID=48 RepID=UPI003B77B54C
MKLDFSSFLLGCGVGASSLLLGRHLRPLLLDMATILYRLQERVMAGTPMGQEALAGLLAEARARACLRAGSHPSNHSTHPPTHQPTNHSARLPAPFGRGTG